MGLALEKRQTKKASDDDDGASEVHGYSFGSLIFAFVIVVRESERTGGIPLAHFYIEREDRLEVFGGVFAGFEQTEMW